MVDHHTHTHTHDLLVALTSHGTTARYVRRYVSKLIERSAPSPTTACIGIYRVFPKLYKVGNVANKHSRTLTFTRNFHRGVFFQESLR